MKERDVVLGVLKERLKLAQEKMKIYVDLKRREVHYQVEDLVLLKVRPYRQVLLWKKRNEKLSPKFFGPYKILEKIGLVAYKLELLDNATIHLVFHVSQLKKVVGPHEENKNDIPMLTKNYKWKVVPEEVYGYLKNKSGSWDVLISWKGLPRHEATWEMYEEVQQRFSDFHLEDKVNLEKECNNRLPIVYQYSRRGKKK